MLKAIRNVLTWDMRISRMMRLGVWIGSKSASHTRWVEIVRIIRFLLKQKPSVLRSELCNGMYRWMRLDGERLLVVGLVALRLVLEVRDLFFDFIDDCRHGCV